MFLFVSTNGLQQSHSGLTSSHSAECWLLIQKENVCEVLMTQSPHMSGWIKNTWDGQRSDVSCAVGMMAMHAEVHQSTTLPDKDNHVKDETKCSADENNQISPGAQPQSVTTYSSSHCFGAPPALAGMTNQTSKHVTC